jgi:hypothetical protein
MEGQKLTLIVSGMLWRNGLIMQDTETGSLWSHITGDALMGRHKGRTLSTVPVVQTTWSDWSRSHPDTKVLKKSREIRSSAYESYFRDPARTGLFRTEWLKDRLPGKELVHGIADGPHSLAVPDEQIPRGELLRATLGEEPVLVVRTSDNGVRAYRARTNKGLVTLQPGAKPGQYTDRETGSLWDLHQGVCLKGKRKGDHLEPLNVTAAFWFAWSTFYPNTHIAP